MSVQQNNYPQLGDYLSYHPSPKAPERILVRIPTPTGKTERHTVRLTCDLPITEAIQKAVTIRSEVIKRLYPEGSPNSKRRAAEAKKLNLPDHIYVINYKGQGGSMKQRVVVRSLEENGKRKPHAFEIGRKWTLDAAISEAKRILSNK